MKLFFITLTTVVLLIAGISIPSSATTPAFNTSTPTARTSTAWTPVTGSPTVVRVVKGKTKRVALVGVPRTNVIAVQVSVRARCPAKAALRVSARGSSDTRAIKLRPRRTVNATVTLTPGRPHGWAIRTTCRTPIRVVVRTLSYQPSSTTPTPEPPVGTPTPGEETPAAGGEGPGTGLTAGARFDIGTPTLNNIWVDPVAGSDSATGLSRGQALRTVTAAWNRIPTGVLATGWRVQLVAGTYPEGTLPNYWENRSGTYTRPIVFNAVDGPGTAVFEDDINMYNTTYFYLIGVAINVDGDAFHCEVCSYILLSQTVLDGDRTPGGNRAHETVKVNQSDHIYVEDSTVSGADDNAIDFVAVAHGHIVGSRISDAGDWCAYVKGGSAYIRVEGNIISDCGTGGFTAGQGTGGEFMTAPWVTYEVFDVKVVNNIIHDTAGAGLGVNGGFNVLLAYNTVYRVGTRSHLLEVVYGLRSCDGDSSGCAAQISAGGWGTTGGGEVRIPNKNVYVYNNVLYNPPGFITGWQHFTVAGPFTQDSAFGVANPAAADDGLIMAGNVVSNGSGSMPVGVGDGSGCEADHPTCAETALRSTNMINGSVPDFVAPNTGDFRPVSNGWLASRAATPIPDFTWAGVLPVGVPSGVLSNAVPVTADGTARSGWGNPGAL